MSILEKEVQKLKSESENFKKLKEKNNNLKNTFKTSVIEDKVNTNYLCSKDDRMQAFKHVTTQGKAEYMSLEELQKLKDENAKKLLQIENQYYEQKLKAEQRAKNIDEFIYRDENKKITIEEINEILRGEENYFQKDFKNKKKNYDNSDDKNKNNKYLNYDENGKIIRRKFQRRPKSTKNIRRFAESELDKPLNRHEENYVKKYVNFVMKKKKDIEIDENEISGQQEDWNKTKILSQNFNGGVNRKDNLTGHLYNDDFSYYYLSINSENTPKSLSLKSFITKNSTSKNKKNSNSKCHRKINEKHLRKNYDLFIDNSISNCNYNFISNNNISKIQNQRNNITDNSRISNKNNKTMKKKNKNEEDYNNRTEFNDENNNDTKQKSNQMNSHLAFGKLIFQLLDKNKKGLVSKLELLKELELDDNILFDLGFENQQNLFQKLQEYKTEKEGYLDEQEFIAFLLSRSDLNEEYLENYRNNFADSNMKDENNYDFDAQADMENMDMKYFQGEEVPYFESKIFFNKFIFNAYL